VCARGVQYSALSKKGVKFESALIPEFVLGEWSGGRQVHVLGAREGLRRRILDPARPAMAPLPWRIEVCWELVWSEVSEREVSVRPSLALSEVEREGPHDSPALLLGDPGYFERKPSLAFTTLAQAGFARPTALSHSGE
jgi:hypothetical protein